MKKEIPLYDQKINEFTDWINGVNSLTGGNDTENLPVSGERIRELIQQKLKTPIFVYHDKEAHLYRIFSSEDAKNIWDSDRDTYAGLEISNFVAPSEYVVNVDFASSLLVYIRQGVAGQSGSKIRYNWRTQKADASALMFSENMSIIYTFKESGKQKVTVKSSNQRDVEEDIFEYLVSGQNTIDIDFKGITTGAEAKHTVIINVLQLNVDTSFDYTTLQRNLSQLQFGMYATRNIKGPLTFKTRRYYYGNNPFNSTAQSTIDGSFGISVAEQNNLTPSKEYEENGTLEQISMKAGVHSVQVWGQMLIDNQVFYSNLLYYIFSVAYDLMGQAIDAITLRYNFNDRIDFVGSDEFEISAVQYKPVTFDWGYIRYVDGKQGEVSWYLRDVNIEDPSDKTETFINTYNCTPNVNAPRFEFTPINYTAVGRKNYLVAYRGSSEIIALPIQIEQSSLGISETTGVDLKLKLSAYGKQNDSITVDQWAYGDYYATFNNVEWNSANGWYNNSLRISGADTSAVINYNPFEDVDVMSKGITIELDFESEFVSSENDEIARLGSTQNSGPHISIYPNKASLYISNTPIITTNYKANERVKLAFIIEPRTNVSDELKNVVLIVNNGIAERAAGWKDYDPSVFSSNEGNIRIGGVNSGIRFYSTRCYTKALTITNAYDNFTYDSNNKEKIALNNDIYEAGEVNLEKCQNKIDVIIISGNLDSVLSRGTTKSGSNTACNIERICVKDPTKNFTVEHGRIRKHGQSTLNYPLTSYKLWSWSSVDEIRPTMTINSSSELPFSKNRYQMKTNAIPANKFVLQANYADSSGVHNGGFERLIQETWYKAKIDGEYKLRTQPQLFTSNQTISPQIWNEGGQQVGDTEMTEIQQRLFSGKNTDGKQWKDYFGDTPFPYTIRNSPDSFPCLVFCKNEDKGDTVPHLLGQYVFMDDKKSDYTYGERSIYKVQNLQAGTNNAQDPFCIKSDSQGNSIWDEKSGERIWDNDKVLRVECLSVNSTLADFRGVTADNSGRRFDHVILGDSDENTSIGWEEDFELVYPEKEEITTSKAFDAQKFVNTVQPFTDWLDWLIGTKGNQTKFQNEAAAHLDLYKMAAYYIFVLRFGLVDSLERNAQIKTYDGVHFHYEPWDIDIALGNRNTGGIAFDPPITRDTMMDADTAAISGKSYDRTNNVMLSNWLFDALEAWPYWMDTIVPKVADALFAAGLTYNDVVEMLDEEYQNAWNEAIYNESGKFKYINNRQNTDDNGNITSGFNDDWLAWLQGARTTHRHWWLKSSMDYYDAKWGVGEFLQKKMYIGCEMHNVQGYINITPISDTYFSFQREATKFGPFSASPLIPLNFDMSVINSGAKVPFYIYGANFIKELDFSDIAAGLQVFNVSTAYSSEVGPLITKINIGVPITTETSTHLEGAGNNKRVTFDAGNALDAIEELNIRGQGGISALSFLSDVRTIKKLYAAGSGLNTLVSCIGTSYDTLELPNTLTSITFNSTTWKPNKLSFWTTIPGSIVEREYTSEKVDEQGNVIYEEDGVTPQTETYTVEELTSAQYNKFDLNDPGITTSIPRSLLTVRFTGTTARNNCARQFVVDWINSIIAFGTLDWNNNTDNIQNTYATKQEYIDSLFAERNLFIENIYWDNTIIAGLTYEQLSYIAKFNNIDYNNLPSTHPNIANFAKGYLTLTDVNELNSTQASYLQTWFGDGVFTLNSGGLVIDQEVNYTVISVGKNAYTSNGEIYLKEGESARISATKFKLQSNLEETSFQLASPGSQLTSTTFVYPAGSGNVACSIAVNKIGDDYLYYLETFPNSTGQDYDVDLLSGASRITIHIKALDYPDQIFLGINGNKKETDIATSGTFFKYFKTADLYAVGSSTGTFIVGLQFKQNNTYTTTPLTKGMNVEYAKFKLYRNDVLCSQFTSGLDYDYFTQGDSIRQTFVDTNETALSYTTGFSDPDSIYNYYIPLYIQNSVTTTPTVYTVTCDIKIGGMVSTISQKFVLVRDDVVAQAGTVLWGLINKAYTSQFSESYDGDRQFYRSICAILNGTIGVSGQYKSGANWVSVSDNIQLLTTLLYNQESILKYLPRITGIDLHGASSLPTKTENIDNFDFSTITDLHTFNIDGCTSLTADFDLSGYSNLTEVDASGTSINVVVPTSAKLTKYELGTPTEISLDSPTVLTPVQVVVDHSANIDSLEIINIPNNKSFTMFDKITTNI